MGLLDYLKTQGEAAANDYAGLLDAYPNANKFLAGLLGNINQHIPSNADFKSPAAMRDWSQAAALNAPMGLAIKAWHGSPHKFDQFDMSKIGTGEGAQAYGHGLYFAESPKVAQEYAEALGKEVLIKGKPAFRAIDNTSAGDLPISHQSMHTLKVNDWNLGKARKMAEDDFIDTGDQFFTKIMDELAGLKPEDIKIKNGEMYKTSLEWPDAAREASDPLGPQHFLDWDKPLSEQPNSIRSALYKLADENSDKYSMLSDAFQPFEAGSTKGSTIHNILSQRGLGEIGNRPEAKEVLSKYGIPGIRYLDGGSRGAGEGSYNYVVFDDKIPKIIERNGVPINKQLAGLLNNL